MGAKKKKESKYLDKGPEKDTVGRRGYDPEQIYFYLCQNVDGTGVIIYSQKDLAEAIDISRESMGNFFKDFESLGLIEKIDYRQFRVLFRPEDVEWNEELYEEFFKLRKRHQPAAYRQKGDE